MDDYQSFPGYCFPSVDEVVSLISTFRDADGWEDSWVPVLADGGGDFFVVDVARGSVVRHSQIGETEHPVAYASLADLAATAVAAMKSGVIFVDGDGYLTMDYSRYGELARALNPTIALWSV